jgi:hypothetical protein
LIVEAVLPALLRKRIAEIREAADSTATSKRVAA